MANQLRVRQEIGDWPAGTTTTSGHCLTQSRSYITTGTYRKPPIKLAKLQIFLLLFDKHLLFNHISFWLGHGCCVTFCRRNVLQNIYLFIGLILNFSPARKKLLIKHFTESHSQTDFKHKNILLSIQIYRIECFPVTPSNTTSNILEQSHLGGCDDDNCRIIFLSFESTWHKCLTINTNIISIITASPDRLKKEKKNKQKILLIASERQLLFVDSMRSCCDGWQLCKWTLFAYRSLKYCWIIVYNSTSFPKRNCVRASMKFSMGFFLVVWRIAWRFHNSQFTQTLSIDVRIWESLWSKPSKAAIGSIQPPRTPWSRHVPNNSSASKSHKNAENFFSKNSTVQYSSLSSTFLWNNKIKTKHYLQC